MFVLRYFMQTAIYFYFILFIKYIYMATQITHGNKIIYVILCKWIKF